MSRRPWMDGETVSAKGTNNPAVSENRGLFPITLQIIYKQTWSFK